MAVSKDEPEEEGDPLSRYLNRTPKRGKSKLERLDALLRQMNLQTAATLDQIEHPPEPRKKS